MNEETHRLRLETLHPIASSILQSIRVDRGGPGHVAHYARWVLELLRLDAGRHEELFVQLAMLAGSYADAGSIEVAASLAALGRIGLESAGLPR